MASYPTLGFDPAPGTLASAEEVAEHVRTTAATIREAADVLGGVGQQDWQGETATAFHESMSEELTPQVATAAESFEAAAAALETWATSLAGFQQQAADLEAQAASALTAVESAAADLEAAQRSDDPDVDTAGPAAQLGAATGVLEGVRGQAQALLESYHSEAEYVASCLADAAAKAPDKSLWERFTGWLGDIEDWIQDYVLPVLEDLIDILAVVVAVAAVIALVATPLGWASLAALAPVLGKIALTLSIAGVAVDAAQMLGGREDGTEFLTGLVGLLAGGAFGATLGKLKALASSGGLFGGPTAVLAGAYGGGGGTPMVAALGIQWDWVAAFAGGGYVVGKAYDDATSVTDTVESMNDVGTPMGRMFERFSSLFTGDGFTTAEQRRDIAAREGAR